MQYRMFGNTGLKVSQLALGTGLMGKAHGYGAEPDEIPGIFAAYADAGGNFIDTSDAYQGGASERAIGAFVASRRDAFVITTKYGRTASGSPPIAVVGNHRKAMVRAVEDSLRRLNTDYIDIYFAHLDDGLTPVEEIVRGFDDLVRAGKIVYGGLSNFPAWRVATARAIADGRGWSPVAAIQIQYSLVARDADRELLPMARDAGLGVMGWSPLGGGLLTGKYRNGEAGRATALKGAMPEPDVDADAAIDEVIAIAADLGVNPGAVALAWVSLKGIIPVIGPRTRSQLGDNLAACALELGERHIQRLERASAIPLGYPHEMLAREQPRLWARPAA